ncbi:MAG: hypothetical protein ABH833_03705 [Parcubacteria group bacterium]
MSTSIQQQTTSMQQMAGASQKLTDLSSELRSALRRFKVLGQEDIDDAELKGMNKLPEDEEGE